MRSWIAVWAAVLAVPILLGISILRTEPAATDWTILAKANVFWIGLQLLLAYLLTVLLVQEDAVMGTRQFWCTRPISGARLLAAKAVGVFMVVGCIPLLVQLPWWLWCGFGGAELARAATETLLAVLVIAVPAMLVATLTDSLSRAILWSLVWFAIVGAGVILYPALTQIRMSSQVGLLLSRATLTVVVAVVEGALIVLLLYVSRRRGAMLGAVAAVAIIVLWSTTRSPWTWLANPEPRELHPERAANLQVNFAEAWSVPQTPAAARAVPVERWDDLRVTFSPRSLIPEFWLHGMGVRQRWTWEGMQFQREGALSRTVNSASPLPGFMWPRPDAETETWRTTESPRRGRPDSGPRRMPDEGEPTLQAHSLVPSSIAARMAATPPAYDARLWLSLLRPVVLNEMPLRAGGWEIGAAHGARIARVERTGGTVSARVVDVLPFSWLDFLTSAARRGQWYRRDDQRGYIVLNRAKGEFVSGWPNPMHSLVIGGVIVGWQKFNVDDLKVRRGDAWAERPGWIDGATLAFVRMETEAVFSRDVKMERFSLRR
jgi:hypothetical protein